MVSGKGALYIPLTVYMLYGTFSAVLRKEEKYQLVLESLGVGGWKSSVGPLHGRCECCLC